MTTMDLEAFGTGMSQAVPFVRTLGLEYLALDAGRAVLRLPDNPAHHNHLGGPHAGAQFTLGESASGAVVLAAFGDQLGRAVPLAVRAEVAYQKLAKGALLAEATLGRPAAEVIAELDAGSRPEFPVAVELRTADGTVTGRMTVVWTLRPHRTDPAG